MALIVAEPAFEQDCILFTYKLVHNRAFVMPGLLAGSHIPAELSSSPVTQILPQEWLMRNLNGWLNFRRREG